VGSGSGEPKGRRKVMFELDLDIWLERKDDPWFLGNWSEADDEGDDGDDEFDRWFEQGFRYEE
jgi:hypothetical protein